MPYVCVILQGRSGGFSSSTIGLRCRWITAPFFAMFGSLPDCNPASSAERHVLGNDGNANGGISGQPFQFAFLPAEMNSFRLCTIQPVSAPYCL